MNKVAIIASNSLRWEPRAGQQAASLAKDGYDVTMFGIRDWGARRDTPFRLDGVRIVLVPSRVWASAVAALVAALPAIVLACAWFLLGVDDLPGASRPWFVWAAVIGAAVGVAAGALVLAQGYFETAAIDAATAARPLTGMLRPVMRAPAVRWLVARLRSRLYWPLLESITASLIAARAVRLRPAVVHCHDIYTLHIGAAVKARTGAALIYDAHEIYEGMARRSPRDAERYARILSRYGPLLDGFIVPNSKNGEYYTRQYDGLPAPVVIPNAKLPSFGLVYDGRLHDAAGLPAAQRIILYAGSLIAERGLEKLIEVGFRLPPDWSMVLMGRGDLYDRLETIRQDMEGAPARTCRTPRVRILPPVSMASLPAWICGATVGVIPHEPTCLNQDLCVPHKLWDYASVGVPMLATDLPLISEAVRGAGMGWVVSACAPAAEIAAVIARLSDAEIDAARSGCTRFMEQEGWTVYEKSLLGLYRTVIDDGRDRRSATGMAPDAAAVGTT